MRGGLTEIQSCSGSPSFFYSGALRPFLDRFGGLVALGGTGAKVEVLSSAEGVPTETFVNKLLKENVGRLWKKYRKAV